MSTRARQKLRRSLAVALAIVGGFAGSGLADDVQFQLSSVYEATNWQDGEDVRKNRAEGPGQAVPGVSVGELGTEPSLEDMPEDELDMPNILWHVRHRAARQVGQPLSYTSFGAFVPRQVDDGVWFADAQFLIDNGGNAGGNFGLGRRWYDVQRDRITGINFWYDTRRTDSNGDFQQGSLGLESLGNRWDFRANYYAPLSDPVLAGGPVNYGPILFQGNSLVRAVQGSQQVALQGVDAEVARRLGNMNIWTFAGAYHYQRGATQLHGVSGGVRGYLAPNLAADVTVTNDRVFDTNIVFGVTWFLPGGTTRGAMPQDVESRLWLPVERNCAVAVADVAGPVSLETLHAPGGGELRFVHVDSAAPPAGPGTFAAPVSTLAAAQAASTPGDIVFVHSGSTFVGESIVLQNGQQLLGEGVVHSIATQEAGVVVLPAGNGGNVLPTIANAPGDAVRLAPNTTVSGLVIQSPGGRGIAGQNFAGDVRIDRVQIQNAGAQGILLDNIHGRVLVDSVMINGTVNEGLLLSVSNVLTTSATLNNVTINGTPAPGLRATNTGPAGATLQLNLNNSDSAQGYQLFASPNGLFELGGTMGVGNVFVNSDNGNVANNGNTTSGGPPTVNVNGNLHIVNPGSIPLPP